MAKKIGTPDAYVGPGNTPGPWMEFGESGEWWIAQVKNGEPGHMVIEDSTDVSLEDSALICAAPDLLVALQGILAGPYGCPFCDSGKLRNPDKGHTSDCPYEVARAAIAKARGETS